MKIVSDLPMRGDDGYQGAQMVRAIRFVLAQAGGRLRALSPRATLERGYAIVRREGELVRSAVGVSPGDAIAVEVADGSFGARVE